jgi:adenylate cyclase
MSLLDELKRRNVLRVGAAYVVSTWLVIQVVETIFPIYGLSDDAIRYVITGLAVGLMPALIFAWAFELTPEGIKKESDIDRSASITTTTAKTLDRAIMIVLAVALGYFAFDKFVLSESRETAIAEAAFEEGRSEAVIDAYGDRSIAVLAFEDMSPDKDQEYMSDGIAEEILNLLAKVPDLRVISRSSAFSFKGKDLPIPEIAAQLSAAYVLEGSVRKAGDQIRITAQLIEAGSDTHRWSETYDRKLENVFDIQDDIAAQVVEELKSTLLGNAPRSQRIDEEAYTLVLQARYLWYRRAPGDEEQSLELYQRAIEIDPGYAPAWTGLSVAYAVAAYKGRIDPDEGMSMARDAAETALGIDPNYSEAHIRMGQALARAKDRGGMLAEYQKAFEIDPNNPLVLGVLANVAGRQGRIEDVVSLYDRAASLDPLGSIWPGNKGSWLSRMRRVDEADVAINRGFELNADLENYRDSIVDVYIIRGEYEKAFKMLEEMPTVGPNILRASIAHYGVGNIEKSDELMAQMKAEGHPLAIFGVASAYAARGENDLAFEWLEKVEGVSPWNLVYSHYIRQLVDDPRWKPWVDSLDWPWEYEY